MSIEAHHERPTIPNTVGELSKEEQALVATLRKGGTPNIDKPSPKGHRKKLVALIAGISLPVAGVAAYVAGRDSSPDATPRPSATGTMNPGLESPTPSPAVSPDTTPTSEIEPTSETTPANPENSEFMAGMEKMSPEQFASLPLDMRTDYALKKYEVLFNNGSLFDFLDQKLQNGAKLYDYSPYGKRLNRFADGQNILNQNTYAEQVSRAWKTNITKSGNGPLDHTTAEKLISGFALNPKSPEYKSLILFTQKQAGAGRMSDETINGKIAVDTRPAGPISLPDGSKFDDALDIKYITSGKTFVGTFVFVPKEQLGEGNGLWLLQSRIRDNS